MRFGAQQRISRGEPVEEEKAEQQVADHRVRATPTEHRGKNLKTQLKDTHTHMHTHTYIYIYNCYKFILEKNTQIIYFKKI